MALNQDQRNLYKTLLDTNLFSDDLHELLKKYKEDYKEIIRLSGTKEELIENIFDAVDNNIIDIKEVQALIKDSEEFGDQHIFLYNLVDGRSSNHYNNHQQIGQTVIPSGLTAFPRLMNMPTQLEWADFRAPNRGVSNSWLMKLYDVKIREVKENEHFDQNTSRRTIVFKREESRLVYILEWNGEKEIEIKISRTSFDSSKSLKKSVGQIKSIVYAQGAGVLVDGDFSKTDLSVCINNILTKWIQNQDIFKLISANFVDSHGGLAVIKSVDDLGGDDLFAEGSRKGAVESYLNGAGKGTGLVIRFLAIGSEGVLRNDVNVIIGRDDVNHIIIPSKIKPQEYRYVRRKIAEFN